MRRRKKHRSLDIPTKANKILNLLLVALLLILARVWHLTVIQYDQRVEEARKPQRRAIVEPAKRGTIRDRFNHPLAINKVQYNAAILYSQIRQIPYRGFKRRDHIAKLSEILGHELNMDPERVEDLIHAKASFYFNIPFAIKEDITEQQYYRLKMVEKDWLGLHCQRLPKRVYPCGRVGCDIIGYMGAISREEYEAVIHEIKILENYIKQREDGVEPDLPEGLSSPFQVRKRLKDLWEHTYTINDYVGKTGIEGRFEEDLRGFHGNKSFYSDARGNFLREFPDGREPLSGKRILLTISSELQEFAEKLLVQNEQIRYPRVSGVDAVTKALLALKQPWMKGGAIVAMDPNTGEILALASYPRFDPNDFVSHGYANIRRWFETESYIAEIWDQKRPLERERYDDEKQMSYDEKLYLTWENYLDIILPPSNDVREAIERVKNVKKAILLQRGEWNLIPEMHPYDKTLLLDLCQLAVSEERFSDRLIQRVGDQSLGVYRDASASMVTINQAVKTMAKNLFHELSFKPWRQEHQKAFLKQKRKEEKEAGRRYAQPYIDLLDKQEKQMFEEFWDRNQLQLILTFLTGQDTDDPYHHHFQTWHRELFHGAHKAISWHNAYHTLAKAIDGLDPDLAFEYLQTLRGYNELNRPLLGTYRYLRKTNGQQFEKDLAAAFYPRYGFGYGRSQAYRQAATQGSIFKLVTGYTALIQRYQQLEGRPINYASLNPLQIVDDTHRQGNTLYLGYFADGKPIPQIYKGGRLIGSYRNDIGKLDIVKAIEMTSNPYFSLLAGDVLEDPEDLARAARAFSYGSKTGIDLPAEISGRVPHDLKSNRNGLYATAIGQHSMIVTPLQTAVMLSSIANGGKVLKPKIVRMTACTPPQRGVQEITCPPHFKYQESLGMAGIDFPIFTAIANQGQQSYVNPVPVEIKRELFMPDMVQKILLNGMSRVEKRIEKTGLASLSRLYSDHPEAISDLLEMGGRMIGKTSTAESVENLDLDRETGTNTYNHVWFGAINFDPQDTNFDRPELVVVVYLRYGGWGKDAAPLAAQIINKWREIKYGH